MARRKNIQPFIELLEKWYAEYGTMYKRFEASPLPGEGVTLELFKKRIDELENAIIKIEGGAHENS